MRETETRKHRDRERKTYETLKRVRQPDKQADRQSTKQTDTSRGTDTERSNDGKRERDI